LHDSLFHYFSFACFFFGFLPWFWFLQKSTTKTPWKIQIMNIKPVYLTLELSPLQYQIIDNLSIFGIAFSSLFLLAYILGFFKHG